MTPINYNVTKRNQRIRVNHQFCFAHGVHLAVCDVLYKNRSVTHIADKDYDYDDNQDEEMYEGGFGIVIPATASNDQHQFSM